MLTHASGAGGIYGLLRAGLRVSLKEKRESCYDFFVPAGCIDDCWAIVISL
jgi:hypothetical protein